MTDIHGSLARCESLEEERRRNKALTAALIEMSGDTMAACHFCANMEHDLWHLPCKECAEAARRIKFEIKEGTK